jgi:hypothetical protein
MKSLGKSGKIFYIALAINIAVVTLYACVFLVIRQKNANISVLSAESMRFTRPYAVCF